MLLAMKNYRTLCKVTASLLSQPNSNVGNCNCSWMRFLPGLLKRVGFGCSVQSGHCRLPSKFWSSKSQLSSLGAAIILTSEKVSYGIYHKPNIAEVCWCWRLKTFFFFFGDFFSLTLGFLRHFCSIFTVVLISHMWLFALRAFRNNL